LIASCKKISLFTCTWQAKSEARVKGLEGLGRIAVTIERGEVEDPRFLSALRKFYRIVWEIAAVR
jgi:hypothetical protein